VFRRRKGFDSSPGVLLYVVEGEGENEDEDQMGCSFDTRRGVVPEFVFVGV